MSAPAYPKTKYYVIVPCVLLGVFVVFQQDFQRKRHQQEQIRAAIAAALDAEEQARRAKLEADAKAEARRRADERRRRDEEREEAKRREFAAALQRIEQHAATHEAAAAALAREVAESEQRLAQAHATKTRLEEEAFDLARQVAQHRIDRRTAEIDLQRTTKMVLARLNESPWTNQAQPAVMP